MIKKIKTNKGFTLIELLVVISIIGILSSFAVVSLNTARSKARDALRKGDMSQIRTALNLYYDDNSNYPNCGTLAGEEDDFGATTDCYNDFFAPALSGGNKPYMSDAPKDPRNLENDPEVSGADSNYVYKYVSDGSVYAIVYRLEDGGVQFIKGW